MSEQETANQETPAVPVTSPEQAAGGLNGTHTENVGGSAPVNGMASNPAAVPMNNAGINPGAAPGFPPPYSGSYPPAGTGYPYGYRPYPPYPAYNDSMPNSANPYVPYKRPEQDEIMAHTATRSALIAVLLCWVFGILLSNILVRGGFGLSVPLLTAGFYAIVLWYFSGKEQRPSKSAYLLLLPIGLIALGFLWNDTGTVYFINTLLLLALLPLQLSRMSSISEGPVFSVQSFYQAVISALAVPLTYLDVPFKAFSNNLGKGKKDPKSAMILLGLLIAFPIAGIFIALFISADEAFGYFIRRLFDTLSIDNFIFDFIFGTIAALFLSSVLITMRARNHSREKKFQRGHGLNGVLASTVLTVLTLVQGSFVAVQFNYLFAGATLPGGYSYAQYARSGFFELCTALCISVAIIILCMIFVNKDENGRLPKVVSCLLTAFILCNYVIIASAVFRMLKYIAAYDLSVKRLMVTWLIIVFAVCMIGAVIKIWNPVFPVLRWAAVTVIVLTIAVNAANVNKLVANYNVDSYLKSMNTSDVRDIDVGYLGSLGPSAAKATITLYDQGEAKQRPQTITALEEQKAALQNKSWKDFCITDIEAAEVLKSY